MMEDLIYGYLIKNCVGYDNRIKAKEIMKKFNIKDHKTFRSYIQTIRDEVTYPRLIGSEAGKSGGYWIIKNLEEYYATAHHLCARARAMEDTFDTMASKFKNEKERGF